jgi:xylose dehydrogenase (NAD/NADP)
MADRLRIGILGAAGIAKLALIPAIRNAHNAEIAGVASRNAPALAGWAKDEGIPRLYHDYAALLADPDIDAVYIPLPNSEHADWTIAAARAGKAVLCEKPLAMTADEAATVVRECETCGTALMEGFMYRFHPQHERVRQIIASGEIGDVVEVQAHLSVDIMSPADPVNVRFSPELGGGALLDMGCYVVHIARSVFAEEPLAVLGRWTTDEQFGVDTAASGILEFSGGRSAVVSCSFKGNSQGFYRVVGRLGLIDLPRGIIPGLADRVSEALIIVSDATGARREERLPPVDQYQLMIEAFADAVLRNGPMPYAAADTVANMVVLDAFAQSARTGMRVAL